MYAAMTNGPFQPNDPRPLGCVVFARGAVVTDGLGLRGIAFCLRSTPQEQCSKSLPDKERRLGLVLVGHGTSVVGIYLS
jgi:hypothetical protein